MSGSEKTQSTTQKVAWQGRIIAVQPRIGLVRSFDQRSHTYLGYALRLRGVLAGSEAVLSVGIGKAAQAKHAFRVGDVASGESVPVPDAKFESVEYYKTSKLRLEERGPEPEGAPPPWHGTPLDLPAYRARGHRRLDPRTYENSCTTCMWGCCMPVEIIIDHWNPQQKRYRFETFCYGPKSCTLYKAGATRKVPGRKGMVWEEEDWIDEDATSHRGEDD